MDSTTAGDDVYQMGSRLEPFFDDWLIESMEGAALRLHHPVPREVALEFNRPWEGTTHGYPSVFQDGDTYRLYYRGSNWDTEARLWSHVVACLAESTDGISWERPDLGLFEFEGSRRNNIILAPPASLDEGRPLDDFFVFKDENPEAPDSQRYKGICDVNWKAWGGGIMGFASPDGLHWKRVQERPVIIDDKQYDGPQGPAFWDSHRGEYRAYLRAWAAGDGEEVPQLKHIPEDLYVQLEQPEADRFQWRTVRYATSKDFIHWTRPALVQFDVPLSMDEQLYTNGVHPYFRAPHIYIGLPKRFAPFRHKILEQNPGVSDGGFMTSRDGVHWKLWREAFIRPGLDQKNWVNRNNLPAFGILETGPGEISVYWGEHNKDKTCRFRRGTIRTDGFVSVNAGYGGGELVTRPLTFEGRELVINYSTSAFGSVRVELQDEAGSALDGYALNQSPVLYGDAIEHTVSWESGPDVSALAGRPVRLRFALTDADLYSIRFTSGKG